MGPGQTLRTTINLAPGRYLAIGEGEPDPRASARYTTFDVGGVPFGGVAAGAPTRASRCTTTASASRRRSTATALLRIENIGRNEHFIAGIRLDQGADPAVVQPQAHRGRRLPGPAAGRVRQRSSAWCRRGRPTSIQANLRPGVYVLACFYADRASAGHGHSEFGMVRQVTVR